jgi:hypothetical protein
VNVLRSQLFKKKIFDLSHPQVYFSHSGPEGLIENISFQDEEPSEHYTGLATSALNRNLLRIKLWMLNKLANIIISDSFANMLLF